jgi:hypothetical protein
VLCSDVLYHVVDHCIPLDPVQECANMLSDPKADNRSANICPGVKVLSSRLTITLQKPLDYLADNRNTEHIRT